jgi:hypothetical protein
VKAELLEGEGRSCSKVKAELLEDKAELLEGEGGAARR